MSFCPFMSASQGKSVPCQTTCALSSGIGKCAIASLNERLIELEQTTQQIKQELKKISK